MAPALPHAPSRETAGWQSIIRAIDNCWRLRSVPEHDLWQMTVQIVSWNCTHTDNIVNRINILRSCWNINAMRLMVNTLRSVTHTCVSELGHYWLRQWLGAYSAPSHCLNQWWPVVNLTHKNKLEWNFNQYVITFIQENALQNVVCKISWILIGHQCVNILISHDAMMPKNFSASSSSRCSSTAWCQVVA